MFSEAERVLQAAAEEASLPVASANIRAHYRLSSVVDFITAQKATRIALQFPDHLLVDTPLVVGELRAMLAARRNEDARRAAEAEAPPPSSSPTATACDERDYKLFVLSDNTFGACCPDEITAAHYTAQCIVHFGYACMSRTNRLPVMYVAERGEFDVPAIEAAVLATSASSSCCCDEEGKSQVVVVLSQPARYIRAQLQEAFAAKLGAEDAARVLIADRPSYATTSTAEDSAESEAQQWVIAGDAIPRLSSSSSSSSSAASAAYCCQRFIFVGSVDSPVLAQLAMIARYNDSIGKEGSDLQILPPTTCSETPAQRAMAANKALRMVDQRLQKRMYNIEVLKGSASVGILVCTLAIKNYRESAETLSRLIRLSGRRCYIIYIGHINEFKIANFADSIDAFVVISCPHSRQAQFPQKDDNFMKPLCSPIEMLIALGHAEFDDPQAYTTGFAECCAKAAAATNINNNTNNGGQRLTNSSAIEGGDDDDEGAGRSSTALLVRGHGGAVAQFSQRTYKGLEARLGATEVQSALVEGKSGIAKGYAAEKDL